MSQPPPDPQVQLGRRRAHGRKVVTGERRAPIAEVLDRITDIDPQQLGPAQALLRRALQRAGGSIRIQPAEQTAATMLAETGWLEVTMRVEGNAVEFRWVGVHARLPVDAADEVAAWAGRQDPDRARAELLDAVMEVGVAPTPPPGGPGPSVLSSPRTRIAGEAGILGAVAAGTPLRVPAASLAAGATASWSAYAAALRAACCWIRHDPDRRLTSRELAALAFGDSKAWTQARKAAFSALLGLPFEVACAQGERAVLVGGALQWSSDGYHADARAAGLWLGLPASSVDGLELDASHAHGVILIENKDTYEAALRVGVGSQHVVLWGSGYVGDAEITLLRRLQLPVGVFADLDPDGIAIVRDVARRCQQPATPLLMDPAHLTAPQAQPASPEQLAMAARLSQELSPSAGDPAGLVELARAITITGRVREQETLHSHLGKLTAQ